MCGPIVWYTETRGQVRLSRQLGLDPTERSECSPCKHVLTTAPALPHRCASPDSLAWIRRSDPSAETAHGHGARNASSWTAFLGMGDQPNQVVAFGATRGTAALARHEWLTANRWLPPLNETKNEEGKASARRKRCGASCRRMLWSHTLANSAVKLLEKERGSEAGSDLRHFTMPKPRRR
jgi:hypothetical protein